MDFESPAQKKILSLLYKRTRAGIPVGPNAAFTRQTVQRLADAHALQTRPNSLWSKWQSLPLLLRWVLVPVVAGAGLGGAVKIVDTVISTWTRPSEEAQPVNEPTDAPLEPSSKEGTPSTGRQPLPNAIPSLNPDEAGAQSSGLRVNSAVGADSSKLVAGGGGARPPRSSEDGAKESESELKLDVESSSTRRKSGDAPEEEAENTPETAKPEIITVVPVSPRRSRVDWKINESFWATKGDRFTIEKSAAREGVYSPVMDALARNRSALFDHDATAPGWLRIAAWSAEGARVHSGPVQIWPDEAAREGLFVVRTYYTHRVYMRWWPKFGIENWVIEARESGASNFTAIKQVAGSLQTELIPNQLASPAVTLRLRGLRAGQADWVSREYSFCRGDVNLDGRIDAQDAQLTLASYPGSSGSSPPEWPSADVNGDGRVSGQDHALVLQYLGGQSVRQCPR